MKTEKKLSIPNLSEKKCNESIKPWGYTDQCPQRLYSDKEERSSPTVSIEAMMLTSTIDKKKLNM